MSSFLICILFLGIYHFLLLPKIDLKGKKTMVVDYKGKYSEKGYEASFFGNDVTDDVEVNGDVNTNKLGSYDITYTVKNGFLSKKVHRRVYVKDRKKPKMEISDEDIYLCPGDEVVPDKIKATDNYDGDLSDKVKATIAKDNSSITYRVTDSSGNVREVVKKIKFEDKEAPKMTLNGRDMVYLFLGDGYEDPGVEVTDNCDKEISSKVKVAGNVDTGVAGEYNLTYEVEDNFHNKSTLSRKVKVSEHGKNGTIYLTFDDGPNAGTTNVILDILKEEGVQATFFVTNKGPDELIKREYDEGHTVALHTASHDYSIVYSSDEAYFEDLYSVQERVKRITGYESKIIRFPGGSSNTVSRKYSSGIMSRLTQEVQNRGFRYYDWNLSSGDAGNTTEVDGVYNNVVGNLRHDRVNMVLMHDIKPYTRDALRRIIQFGKDNGYTFEKITMDTEMITQRVNN